MFCWHILTKLHGSRELFQIKFHTEWTQMLSAHPFYWSCRPVFQHSVTLLAQAPGLSVSEHLKATTAVTWDFPFSMSSTVVVSTSPLVWGLMTSTPHYQHFHCVRLFRDPVVFSSLGFLSNLPAGCLLPGSAFSPFDFTTSFLPESIVPAFSRRLTPKQSLPPAVTI